MSRAVTYETTEYGRLWIAPKSFNEVYFGTPSSQPLVVNRVAIEVLTSEAHRNSDGTWALGEQRDHDYDAMPWSIASRRADWRERGYRKERPSDSAQRKIADAALAAVRTVARDGRRFEALVAAAQAERRADEIVVATNEIQGLVEQRYELDRQIAEKRELLDRLRAA